MKLFRFIHAADLHLDSPFRGMQSLPEAVRERVRESTFTALNGLVELAVRETADFVVIAGDVYDASDRSLRAQIRFQKAMDALHKHNIPVFIIHGNHDPLDGRGAQLSWPPSVHFFPADDVRTVPVRIGDRGVVAHIHGISYGSAAMTENLSGRYAVKDASVFNIALLHTNVDGDGAHDNYAPCRLDELVRSGFHYWALGHIHNRRVLSERPPVVYPGNLQGRSVRETGAKGCYVVDVADDFRTALAFHALDDVRWQVERLSIQGMENVQELKDAVENEMERVRTKAGGRASVIRLVLEGRGPLHRLLGQEPLLRDLTAEIRDAESGRVDFVWIESFETQTGADLDREALKEQNGFLGELMRMSERLADDPLALGAFADRALEPLQGHIKLGRHLAGARSHEELQAKLRAAEELILESLAGDGGWDG